MKSSHKFSVSAPSQSEKATPVRQFGGDVSERLGQFGENKHLQDVQLSYENGKTEDSAFPSRSARKRLFIV